MKDVQRKLLDHSFLNNWRLFWLIFLPTSIWVLIALAQICTDNPANISGMIALTVRLAVPWLFLAFAASSLAFLIPGKFSRWIVHNRRIFGLCFAAGMAWQLLFIVWLVTGFFDYYMEEAYSYYDLAEQIPGYVILFAMTVTSFRFGRRMISGRQWRILHKGGIYFLWAVVWSTYWFELYYYDDIQVIDYVYYWLGIAAWGVRIVAWTKKRTLRLNGKAAAGILAGLGVYLIAFGGTWSALTLGLLPDSVAGGWIELLVPFMPMAALIAAAFAGSQRVVA